MHVGTSPDAHRPEGAGRDPYMYERTPTRPKGAGWDAYMYVGTGLDTQSPERAGGYTYMRVRTCLEVYRPEGAGGDRLGHVYARGNRPVCPQA